MIRFQKHWADPEWASLTGASLSKATLDGVICADLSGALNVPDQ
jgi:uncharacterized protein YjbI with pentapeptide repeats